MLMYLMPGVIFFIFNQFASALSLYYLTYNVVTAVQQKWINYQLEQEKEAKEKGGGRPKSSGDGAAANGSGGGFLERLRKKVDEAR
jgi:YidC/Oxa1 family membrane protein insertase